MKKLTGTLASLAVITALSAPAFAQDPQPTTQPRPQPTFPQTQEPQVDPRQQSPRIDMSTQRDDSATLARHVTGELVKVDSDLMEMTIKAADDKEHTFRYTDATKVEGADEQVSGLATKAGQLVTVHFIEGAGDARIATKVKFDTKKQ